MKSFRSDAGAITAGLVIAIFAVLFIAYEAMQFGPALMAQFQFQDAVMEAAKFSRNKTAGAVQQEVYQKAAELKILVTREMIKVTRQPTNTRIQVIYSLEAEWLPGRPYKWEVNLNEESMLF